MSDTDTGAAQRVPESTPVAVNSLVLHKSKLPFAISLAAFLALLLLIFLPAIFSLIAGRDATIKFDFGPTTTPFILMLALYLPHGLLFITTIVSGYIGYKLVVASGANPESPIPPNNYALLAPLIRDGKSDAIDQYVRLSSLRGFTGTFTKLGLTGLPLATIGLTLFFAMLALLPLDTESQRSFFDLTKLTLGAFIGSFVQKQVERRTSETKEAEAPQEPPLSR